MTSSRQITEADLLAREAIRDLIARYNAYGDSGLYDAMMDLFAPDAEVELFGRLARGRQEIEAMFRGVSGDRPSGERATPPRYVRHCTATHQIDLVNETTATGRSYLFVMRDEGLTTWGRYLDDYAVVDGEWRIVRRRVVLDPTE